MADRGADKPSSRTGSPDGESQVSEDRWSLHQRLAIRELIDTEASYLHMLQLCASDLRSRLQQLPQGDLDVLFSNIDDVIKVNSRFLQDLQETDSREEEQAQLIGNLFLEFQEELEGAYKVYCANYDQALLLVESYRQEPELQRQIQGIIEAVVITKYTLLLQKILENTLPDASAYPVLQRATSAFQAVNININEYKRRKEVASKYTKVEQLTLRERLARINTHTLSKKTTRLSQLLKQEVGLVPKTEDKEFDDLEEKFHWVSLCVTELKNNLATYLDNLEAFLRFRPQEYDLDIPEGPMGQYCNLARDLQLQAFPEFKQRLEGLVWQPLCNLAKALAGPQNLIKKRLDKLLDFERLEEKLLEVGSVTYEEEEARHTYQALNSLLVAELPQFNQLAGQWLGQMLRTFVALQRDLAKRVLQSAEGSLAQLPHHQLSEPAFRKLVEDVLSQTSHQLRSFQENLEKALPPPPAQAYCLVNCHHQLSEPAFRKLVEDVLSQTSHQLRSFQENLEKALPPPPAQEGLLGSLLNSWCPINTILVDGKLTKRKLAFPHSHMWEPLLPGAEHQVQALLSRYGPGKLYQVTGNISGAGTLDLTLPRGQIVALLQNQDTKGNRSRWLVDTGGHRGYVPAGKLKLYYVTPSEEKLREQAQPLENVRHLTPEPTSARVPSVPTRTQVVAVYPFVARSSHEVSLQAGQPVTVLEAQDKKGNPEWSLVEADGQQGYVPSSFLARALSPAPWGWSPPS